MNYFYEAVDAAGKTVVGKMEAATEADAQQKLLQSGFRPQSIVANTAALAPATPPGPNVGAGVTDALQHRFQGLDLGTQTGPASGATATQQAGTVYPAGDMRSGTVAATRQATGSAARSGGITLAGNAARAASKLGAAAKTASALPGTAGAAATASDLGGVGARELMFFFQQLASLTHSGISIFAGLENLAARTQNPNLARAIREMAQQAHTGGRISDVMEQYPRIYPAHIVGMVRAGELGGYLEVALAEIARGYEENIALYRGSWFPKLLATQAFFMFALAQPLFPTLFPNFEVARYLQLVFLRNLPITLALYLLLRLGSQRVQLPQYRRWRDEWSLKLPPFGDLQRQAAIATFLRALRRLYHAGIAPINAWEGAMNTASNVVIREKLEQSYGLMQQGASLPDAFAATGLFASSVEQLIVTGHQSGQVVESLDKAAEYYQEQADEAASKSRFMIFRLGVLAALILGGGTLIWLMHTYFKSIFEFAENF